MFARSVACGFRLSNFKLRHVAGRPVFIYFMANCNFHFNLRRSVAQTEASLRRLLLSAAAAYNFVYNYIDSKGKTQVVAVAAAAAAAATAAAFSVIPAKSAHLQATLT